jgi:pSer/pThr/pTyr-binding forkhead associated (FHA) protein
LTGDVPYLVDGAGRRFPIVASGTTLGRSRKCDIYVPDRRASRRHAEVRWDGELCVLRDLESANGTYLNGRRVTEPQPLRDGDEIGVASAVLAFHDPDATLREDDRPLLVVDEASGEIWVNRVSVSLSPKEQVLFELLNRNAGQPCSKPEIATAVWPEYQADVGDYQVESLVKRLREKLEPNPRSPVLILTVRGRGYKLVFD